MNGRCLYHTSTINCQEFGYTTIKNIVQAWQPIYYEPAVWVQRQGGCKGNSCKGNAGLVQRQFWQRQSRVGAKKILPNELILGCKAILGAKAILAKVKQGGYLGKVGMWYLLVSCRQTTPQQQHTYNMKKLLTPTRL